MEKLTFALIMAALKLKSYFQAHTIVVQMDKPFRKTMDKPEATERLVLWAIELSEFDIRYHPRIVIKAQALIYFITEFITNETNDWGATP